MIQNIRERNLSPTLSQGKGIRQFAANYGYHTKAGDYTYSNGVEYCPYPHDAVLMYVAEFNVYAPYGQTMSYVVDEYG